MAGIKANQLLRLLLNAGIILTAPEGREKLRDGLSDRLDDLSDRASKTYEEAKERLDRATRAVRGERSSGVENLIGFLAGVGVGVGLGILFAPASGEETRAVLGDKIQGVQSRASSMAREIRRSTGTEG